MAKIPLFPDLGKEFTVVEYPSNAQTSKLIEVLLRSAGISRDLKEQLIERPGFTGADISEDLTTREADMKAAAIVVKEDLPESATWDDLSSNALVEAIQAFLGIGTARSAGQGIF
jgi:hypothetical protein